MSNQALREAQLVTKWRSQAENGRKLSHKHPDLIENTAVWALEACADELEAALEEMIAWLTELNLNWAVCRNTRAFKEGQPAEYWKKFDAAMGDTFELQIALMKLAAQPAAAKQEGVDGK